MNNNVPDMSGESGGILSNVTNTFKRITSISNQKKVKSFEQQLVEMNKAPLLARRDAAYDRAVYLLRQPLFSFAEEDRSQIYKNVLALLAVSLESGQALSAHYESHGKELIDPVNQYMVLATDTVQAAYALVKHEVIMFKEEKELSSFIGSDATSQIRSTDEIFSNSEMNIYHCITELVEMADPAIRKYRDFNRKGLQKEDLSRYDKAFEEYNKIYGEWSQKNLKKVNTSETITNILLDK